MATIGSVPPHSVNDSLLPTFGALCLLPFVLYAPPPGILFCLFVRVLEILITTGGIISSEYLKYFFSYTKITSKTTFEYVLEENIPI